MQKVFRQIIAAALAALLLAALVVANGVEARSGFPVHNTSLASLPHPTPGPHP